MTLFCPECEGVRMHHLTFAHTTECTIRAADDQTAVNDGIRARECYGSRFSRPPTDTELLLIRPLIIDPETGEDRYSGFMVRVHHYGVHDRTVTAIDRHDLKTTII